MPIVIKRETGSIISATPLVEKQGNSLWEKIVEAYIKKHPEILKEETND